MLDALFLLLVANGSPVLVHFFLGQRFAYPLDGHGIAPDGFPWLGHSKTFRGIFVSIISTIMASIILGVPWDFGALFGACAMLGDVFSSFIKRRAGMVASSKASGLDQIPESLFPLIICSGALGLIWQEVIILVLIFWLLEVLLSKLLYRLHIRDRPY